MWKCTKCGTNSEDFEIECRNCGLDKEISDRRYSEIINENNDEITYVNKTDIYETENSDEVKMNKNKIGKWVDSIAGIYLLISSLCAVIGAYYMASTEFYGEFEVGIFLIILIISAISIFLVYLALKVVSEILHLLQRISDNTSDN